MRHEGFSVEIRERRTRFVQCLEGLLDPDNVILFHAHRTHAHNAVQRRLEFVRDIGDEQSFAFVRCFGGLLADFQLARSIGDLVIQRRVLLKQFLQRYELALAT